MPSEPLTKAQIQALSKALYNVNQAQLEIERAQTAGLEMEEQMLRCAHQRQRLEALLRVYATESP